jgi:hypothetical protein
MIKNVVKTGAVVAVAASVAGCMGPTYGTGKTSGEHLMDDLGGALSLAPADHGKAKIQYTPRPDIVKPADTSSLPAPQQNIADSSAEWPESPEQKRQRILTDIENGKRSANFVTSRADADALGSSAGPGRGATGGGRVFLTDPPAEYTQPASTAVAGELGETEAKKERARKRAQGKDKTGLRRLFPWL